MTDQNDSVDLSSVVEELKQQVKTLTDRADSLESENKKIVAHNDKLVNERKAEKDKYTKELEDKESKTKEDKDQLMQQYKDKVTSLEDEINNYKTKEYTNNLNSKAKELALSLAKNDAVKTEDLAEKFAKRIKIEEDGSIKVLDANGNVTISPVDSLVTELSTRYAYLCDGVGSTGGGSHSSGTGNPPKKLSEMNESEKVQLIRTDRAKYDELKKAESA